jgi:hypothetical protein
MAMFGEARVTSQVVDDGPPVEAIIRRDRQPRLLKSPAG